jgi:spore coat polysaccharide biosynthesis predicted glycosyltransferase SpsG
MTKLMLAGLSVQGETYGIGHASRLRYLLSESAEKGWKISQFDITEVLSDQTQVLALISELSFFECVIIDVDPRFARENYVVLSQVFVSLQQFKCALVIIDSRTDFPISQIFPDIQFNLAICPYGTPGVEIDGNKITGFGATIFEKSLRDLRSQIVKIVRTPRNVLITCGGSDPLNITTLYLRSLNLLVSRNLKVNIVIGSHFPQTHLQKLEREAKESCHQIQFIFAPKSLTQSYLGVDIALVTGGLTRNEVLFVGIPAVVTDLNIDQEFSTKLFELGGGLLRAGTYHEDSEEELIDIMRGKTLDLLNSQTLRKDMNNSARLLMPDGGVELVLREIERICNKQNQL